MAIKLGRMVTYLDMLLSIKLHMILYHSVLKCHVTNGGHFISTTTVYIATELDSVVPLVM